MSQFSFEYFWPLKLCNDEIAVDYARKLATTNELFECSKLSVYNTNYRKGQYVLLPSSTNDKPEFGKIQKLLVSDQGKDAYLYYQKCSNHYCHDTDLFIVNDCEQFGIISTIKLPDYHPIEVERLISQAKENF